MADYEAIYVEIDVVAEVENTVIAITDGKVILRYLEQLAVDSLSFQHNSRFDTIHGARSIEHCDGHAHSLTARSSR